MNIRFAGWSVGVLGAFLVACGGSDSGAITGSDGGGAADGTSAFDALAPGVDGAVVDDSGSLMIDPTLDGATPPGPGTDAGDALDAGSAADGATDTTCGAATTKAACSTCCAAVHPAGDKAYTTEVERCACKAATCAKDCETTVCATPAKRADATCTACLDQVTAPASDAGGGDGGGGDGGRRGGGGNTNEGACTQTVRTACLTSAPCTAFAKCEELCAAK